MSEKLFAVEIAEITGFHVSTVLEWMREGRLGSVTTPAGFKYKHQAERAAVERHLGVRLNDEKVAAIMAKYRRLAIADTSSSEDLGIGKRTRSADGGPAARNTAGPPDDRPR